MSGAASVRKCLRPLSTCLRLCCRWRMASSCSSSSSFTSSSAITDEEPLRSGRRRSALFYLGYSPAPRGVIEDVPMRCYVQIRQCHNGVVLSTELTLVDGDTPLLDTLCNGKTDPCSVYVDSGAFHEPYRPVRELLRVQDCQLTMAAAIEKWGCYKFIVDFDASSSAVVEERSPKDEVVEERFYSINEIPVIDLTGGRSSLSSAKRNAAATPFKAPNSGRTELGSPAKLSSANRSLSRAKSWPSSAKPSSANYQAKSPKRASKAFSANESLPQAKSSPRASKPSFANLSSPQAKSSPRASSAREPLPQANRASKPSSANESLLQAKTSPGANRSLNDSSAKTPPAFTTSETAGRTRWFPEELHYLEQIVSEIGAEPDWDEVIKMMTARFGSKFRTYSKAAVQQSWLRISGPNPLPDSSASQLTNWPTEELEYLRTLVASVEESQCNWPEIIRQMHRKFGRQYRTYTPKILQSKVHRLIQEPNKTSADPLSSRAKSSLRASNPSKSLPQAKASPRASKPSESLPQAKSSPRVSKTLESLPEAKSSPRASKPTSASQAPSQAKSKPSSANESLLPANSSLRIFKSSSAKSSLPQANSSPRASSANESRPQAKSSPRAPKPSSANQPPSQAKSKPSSAIESLLQAKTSAPSKVSSAKPVLASPSVQPVASAATPSPPASKTAATPSRSTVNKPSSSSRMFAKAPPHLIQKRRETESAAAAAAGRTPDVHRLFLKPIEADSSPPEERSPKARVSTESVKRASPEASCGSGNTKPSKRPRPSGGRVLRVACDEDEVPGSVYNSVVAAAKEAKSGDQIVVSPGTYRERTQIDLHSGVTLRAADGVSMGDVILIARSVSFPTIGIRGDDVVIRGVTIKKNRSGSKNAYPAIIDTNPKIENFQLIQCRIDGSYDPEVKDRFCQFQGIFFDLESSGRIENCIIENIAEHAIVVNPCSMVHISGGSIRRCQCGAARVARRLFKKGQKPTGTRVFLNNVAIENMEDDEHFECEAGQICVDGALQAASSRCC